MSISALSIEVIRWCILVGAILLTVNLVLDLGRAHLGSVSGTPQVLAEAFERVVLISFCFFVVATSGPVGDQVKAALGTTGAGSPDSVVAIARVLGGLVVRVVLGGVGAWMAIAVATGGLAAQISGLTGNPDTRSVAFARVFLVLMTGSLTLLAVTIADLIIRSAI